MAKLAFLGLGVMGAPMAGHLVRAGHDVTIYNRTTSKAEALKRKLLAEDAGFKVAVANTPARAAEGAEIVMACVGADADIIQVATAESGAFSAMQPGALFIDHSTVAADTARFLVKEAASKDIAFMDAPVSGGEAGAVNGKLTIMCGATKASFDHAKPILDIYGLKTEHIGDVGAGQLAKMVNQVCIAGVLQGLSEAIILAERSGLDVEKVMDTIQHGAAGSWQMQNRSSTMVAGEYDFGFAVDLMRKDLGIVLSSARKDGISLPLTALVDQFYGDVQNIGFGGADTSSLIERLRLAYK